MTPAQKEAARLGAKRREMLKRAARERRRKTMQEQLLDDIHAARNIAWMWGQYRIARTFNRKIRAGYEPF